MARAFGVDHQLFVAGRDLLGGHGVTDLSLALADETYEATAFRQAAKSFDYARCVGECPLSLTAWLDDADTPAAVARGLQERTVSGGLTMRFWPGRGKGSVVAPDVNLNVRTYQFSKENPAKLEASGRLNGAVTGGRFSGPRGALSLEDGTITGDTGTATLSARAVDLRGAPLRRVSAYRFDPSGGRLFFDSPRDDVTQQHVVVGDLLADDAITGSPTVTNLVRVTAVDWSDTRREDVITCENAAGGNVWAAGQPSRAAYVAAGASGTFRVVKHAVSTDRPSHGGDAQVHAMVVHVPEADWTGDANRLQIRPAYRDLTTSGGRTAWDQSQAGATIQPSDLPWFGWLWFVGGQTAEVAFDWVFSRQGGALGPGPRSFRVLADYAPIVAQI